MYLEIEFQIELFTKFSLEFLRFYGALGYFSRFFYEFWCFFKIAQNRSIVFDWSTKSFGPSLIHFAQNVLRHEQLTKYFGLSLVHFAQNVLKHYVFTPNSYQTSISFLSEPFPPISTLKTLPNLLHHFSLPNCLKTSKSPNLLKP